MTENKRFTVEDDDADIWEDNHFLAVAYNHHNAKKIAKRFNQLNDENKQLKHKLSQQEMEYATTACRQAEENEQLKADKQSLIDFIKKEFPKSHKHILEGFE